MKRLNHEYDCWAIDWFSGGWTDRKAFVEKLKSQQTPPQPWPVVRAHIHAFWQTVAERSPLYAGRISFIFVSMRSMVSGKPAENMLISAISKPMTLDTRSLCETLDMTDTTRSGGWVPGLLGVGVVRGEVDGGRRVVHGEDDGAEGEQEADVAARLVAISGSSHAVAPKKGNSTLPRR